MADIIHEVFVDVDNVPPVYVYCQINIDEMKGMRSFFVFLREKMEMYPHIPFFVYFFKKHIIKPKQSHYDDAFDHSAQNDPSFKVFAKAASFLTDNYKNCIIRFVIIDYRDPYAYNVLMRTNQGYEKNFKKDISNEVNPNYQFVAKNVPWSFYDFEDPNVYENAFNKFLERYKTIMEEEKEEKEQKEKKSKSRFKQFFGINDEMYSFYI